MPFYLKITSLFLLATVKYLYSPVYAYLLGLSFSTSVVTILLAGIAGFLFFYYLSYFIIISTKLVKPIAGRYLPASFLERYNGWKQKRANKKENRKTFTRRNRFLVKLRLAGMWAIIITTPFFLSIPLGAFLLRKYYPHRRGSVLIALVALVIEGFVFCWLVWNIPELQL